jgi:hypothetical protein
MIRTDGMTRAANSAAHQLARRYRWLIAIVLVWLSWALVPPTNAVELASGLAVVLVIHRMLAAPKATTPRRRLRSRKRWALMMVVGILFCSTPPAWADDPADDNSWGVPTSADYCRYAPTAETTGTGVTGLLDPQSDLPMDGTVYGDRGYAGMFWFAYDPGCTSTAASNLLGQTGSTAFDSSGASADTQFGNILLKAAKLELAAATGMRARALNLNYFSGLDSIIATGIGAIQDLLITPWIGLPLVLLGLLLLGLARRGEISESAQRVGIAMVGLVIIAFLGNYPLAAAGAADKAIVDLQKQFDQGFLTKLPESVTPTVTYCQYDFSQFDQPPTWDDNGNQLIAGTACTITYRPTMNPADTFTTSEDGVIQNYAPTYFEDFYYPEVMVDNLIFPYWQQGLLGTDDRTGPNYDLAKSFLRGQSVTEFEQAQNDYNATAAAKTPVGAVYCTFDNNVQVCGRSEEAGPPGRIMNLTEANYRQAIESAGPGKYPYIQGRAGNRTAAGATAFVAVTAAAPLQIAAYTGVFAGRLLLRLFVFAGLICGLALFLFPKLLKRMLNTIGSALATVLLLSAAGSLMSFLTLQLIANPTVFGAIGRTGGLVILAVISILIWMCVRPLHRLGAMLSTAAVGNPNALSNVRRSATGLARRGTTMWMMSRLLRRRGGGGRRTSADDENGAPAAAPDGTEGPTAAPRDARRPRPEGQAATAGTPAAAGHRSAQRARTAAKHTHAGFDLDIPATPATSSRAEQSTTRLNVRHANSTPASMASDMTDPRADASGPSGPWSPSAPRSARAARIRSDWGTPAYRSTEQPIVVVDAEDPDDPQRLRPRPASRSASGAFVISDVSRHDIFRPAESEPRRRFTGSPAHQPEISGTPWRPELSPVADERPRPETGRVAEPAGANR